MWTDGDRPFGGKHKIKVFSCVAPTSLIYEAGGRPTCQFSFADAGWSEAISEATIAARSRRSRRIEPCGVRPRQPRA
jgi:hypothetical protein